jgi:hypothetical protein
MSVSRVLMRRAWVWFLLQLEEGEYLEGVLNEVLVLTQVFSFDCAVSVNQERGVHISNWSMGGSCWLTIADTHTERVLGPLSALPKMVMAKSWSDLRGLSVMCFRNCQQRNSNPDQHAILCNPNASPNQPPSNSS